MESDWSSVRSFEATDPYIEIVAPNGGEEWKHVTDEVIRWQTNIYDTVLIDLLANQQNILTIGKVPGNIKAFEWQIPGGLSPSPEYRIQITSLADVNLFAASEQSFSIVDTITSIAASDIVINDYILHQNYPNPFNPRTTIRYQLPTTTQLELSIYSLLGEKVVTLVHARLPAGNYQAEWDASGVVSGLYFYRLETGNGIVQTKKLILLK